MVALCNLISHETSKNMGEIIRNMIEIERDLLFINVHLYLRIEIKIEIIYNN